MITFRKATNIIKDTELVSEEFEPSSPTRQPWLPNRPELTSRLSCLVQSAFALLSYATMSSCFSLATWTFSGTFFKGIIDVRIFNLSHLLQFVDYFLKFVLVTKPSVAIFLDFRVFPWLPWPFDSHRKLCTSTTPIFCPKDRLENNQATPSNLNTFIIVFYTLLVCLSPLEPRSTGKVKLGWWICPARIT